MSTLLTFGLANAVCAALLAVVALLVGRFCRRPAVLHSLWLLVLLKLVTPPVWPITVANLPEEPPPPAETTTMTADPTWKLAISEVQPGLQPPGSSSGGAALAVRSQAEPGNEKSVASVARYQTVTGSENIYYVAQKPVFTWRTTTTAPAPAKPQGLADCVPFLCLAWLAGIVVWLIWVGLRVVRFQRLLRHARLASSEIQEQCDRLAAQMGLRRGPEIWLLPGPLPPLVWAALGRVRIFFPAKLLDRLDTRERGSLLAHELAHVRRRDHWVRWLEVIASALYWWYPLVWLARRRLHVHEEECCDAWVIGEMPARVYAGAIVNTLDFLAEDRAPLPVMASGLSGIELMKRRLSRIMAGGAPKRLSSSGKVALAFVGIVLLSMRPHLAHTESKPPDAEETKDQPAAKDAAEQKAPAEESTAFDPQPKELPGPKLESAPLAITVSPDSKTLALALADQTVQLRDAVTGTLRVTLKGHEDAVTCLAFAPDSKLLASGSPDRRVRVWDTTNGKLHHVLEGHSTWIYSVAFSPDGKTLASGSYDKTIRLWEPASGAVRRILKGHKASVRALAFSPDGKTLASAGSDRTIRLWPMNAEGDPIILKGHEDTIRALAFSRDGKTLASASDDQTVKLWDPTEKNARATLRGGHTTDVTTVLFSPQGKIVLSGAAGGGVIVWDAATGTKLSDFIAHNDAVSGLTYLDGNRLLTAGLDGTVKIWQAQAAPMRLLRGHTGPVISLVISRDGRRLLSGSGWPEGDRTARLWDLKTGKELRRFRVETPRDKAAREIASQIGAVAFSPDGKQAVAAGASGMIFMWDAESGAELRRFRGHAGEVSTVEFTPDAQHLLSGGQDKSIRLWEVKSGRQVRTFEGHTDWVRSVRIARDGKRFLSGGRDGVMRLWDMDSGKQVRQFLAAPKGWTESVAWMPGNRQAVCAGGDSEVQIWDVESGKRVRTFSGHSYGVTCVDVAPDGRSILSCGYDWTIRWWDVATGQQRGLFPNPGFARAVKFSPDGRLAITAGGGQSEGNTYTPGGNDFPIRIWSLRDERTTRSQASRERQRPEASRER